MNIFNLKRQVAGYMLMCSGGASEGGGSNPGDAESGKGYSNRSYEEGGGVPSTPSTTDESGQPYQSNGGQPMYGADTPTETAYQSNGGEPMYGADTPTETAYQSNGGEPMYGPDAQAEAAPTGISAGGDYSGYTTGTGYTNDNTSDAAPYAKDMTENEKTGRSIVGFTPANALLKTVEGIGKFFQPGGSILKRGESGMPSAHGFEDDYLDEDGNPIVKKKPGTGLINAAAEIAAKPSPAVMDFINNPQQQNQQANTAPQAATPTYAGGAVDATMYGSGSGWGATIAKFTQAKQGVQS